MQGFRRSEAHRPTIRARQDLCCSSHRPICIESPLPPGHEGEASMQSPVIIFDHINQSVTVAPQGATIDDKVQKALAAQREQVTSSGSSPAS